MPFKSIPLWRLQKYKKRVISLLYHEDLKMVYFSVAMAVYFCMAIYTVNNHVKYTKVPFKSIPLWRLQKYKKRVINPCCVTMTSKWYTFQWQWRYTFGWVFTESETMDREQALKLAKQYKEEISGYNRIIKTIWHYCLNTHTIHDKNPRLSRKNKTRRKSFIWSETSVLTIKNP